MESRTKNRSPRKTVKRLALGFVILAALCTSGYLIVTRANINPNHTVGEAIDSLDGVYVYYNGGTGNVEGRNTSPDGYNIGLKYQCVEFVKRYYYEHYKHKMPDSYGHAKDFFDSAVADGKVNKRRNLLQYTNPSASQPRKGDLLVYGPTAHNPYGHVAIVAGVSGGKIEVIQQNPGPTAPSRIFFGLSHEDGKWKIEKERIMGWLRMKNQ